MTNIRPIWSPRDSIDTAHQFHLELHNAALDALSQNLPTPFDSIPVFNDDPHTTLSDVLAVFDKAIVGGA